MNLKPLKKKEARIFTLAKERGVKVQQTAPGYLLQIPLFQENRPLSYLPYRVNTIGEVESVARRLWGNENYKQMVKKAQAAEDQSRLSAKKKHRKIT